MNSKERIELNLKDNEWPLDYINHDRNIARDIYRKA